MTQFLCIFSQTAGYGGPVGAEEALLNQEQDPGPGGSPGAGAVKRREGAPQHYSYSAIELSIIFDKKHGPFKRCLTNVLYICET